MVQADGGDDGQAWCVDDIGRIQPPAKTHFQQRPVRRGAGKGQKGRTGGDFKECDRIAAIGGHAFVQQRGKLRFRNQGSRKPDAFMKPGQMWRGIGMHALARRFQPGTDHRLGGPLAIGPGDMDDRWDVAFRMVQRRKKPVDTVQRQVDDLGMQRHHPLEDDVRSDTHALTSAVSAGSAGAMLPGGGRSPRTAGGSCISSRVRTINSSRSALRWVTRSSMP